MAGLDSAGITEIISHVLQEIDTTTRAKAQQVSEILQSISLSLKLAALLTVVLCASLLQAIFVTGGSSLLPGIVSRLRTSLQPLLPYQSSFNVLHPKEDPRLDAWLGMAEWARSDAFAKGTGRVTKADYEEHGGEFVREWEWGNWRTG
jgi:actin-related protein